MAGGIENLAQFLHATAEGLARMGDDGHVARRRGGPDLPVRGVMAFLVTGSPSFILPEASFD